MKRPNRYAVAALATAALAGAGAGIGVYAAVDGTSTPMVDEVRAAATPAASTTAPLSIHQIYANDGQGVVEITATSTAQSSPFEFGGGTQQAEGTGFVYDDKGDIVTNEHVVAGASSITVKFADGSTAKARLVGTDATTDLAVIRVDVPSSKLVPLQLADSSKVQVGDGVVAIGSPYGLEGSVTAGIVSALHREITSPNNSPIEDAIQTDAAINHGNSGGPLLDLQGHVIGITSQIESDSGVNDGVGFAVPSDTVANVVGQLLANGKAKHALLGIQPRTVSNGVNVTQVEAGSGAAKAGLQRDDVITAVDGSPVKTAEGLRGVIAAKQPGDKIQLTIVRNGKTRTVAVTLGERSIS